jgi:hypothetical protein
MAADRGKRARARSVDATACAVLCTLIALGAAGAGLAAGRHTAAAPPTEATYRKLCRAIRAPHVRALFTTSVAPIQLGGSSDCAFYPRGGAALGAGVQVFLRIDDGDQTLWKHRGDHPYGKFRSLAVAGARAKWGYQGGRWPSVIDTRDGTFTCTLIPASGGTGLVGFPGPALTAARSFAEHAVRLCEDVFAVRR